MTEQELINKIRGCVKMSELDALRMECVKTDREDFSIDSFKAVQAIFIKQKNKIIRNGGSHQ